MGFQDPSRSLTDQTPLRAPEDIDSSNTVLSISTKKFKPEANLLMLFNQFMHMREKFEGIVHSKIKYSVIIYSLLGLHKDLV